MQPASPDDRDPTTTENPSLPKGVSVDDTTRTVRVPVRMVLHEFRRVLALADEYERVEIASNGRVVLIAHTPHPGEVAADELAGRGLVPADWRTRQAALRRRLATLPTTTRPGTVDPTAAVRTDRQDDGRTP
ncbi:hypothetical protein GCM10012275_63960 [Longimycelium tulufanense]|uniref:Uncharacterized protein n=1 Tax=Longimycelium tulufanense TaxID=907463 RepID=A0A8J3CLC9_9PSEU|nr:hypothetical protein [Longimycelium tulufanense]GGM84460.1 hypothetical protein GCM10012275_63960 [Longimycelium tulufanense]